MENILFSDVTAVTLDADAPVRSNAYVLVADGKISSISDRPPSNFTGERIDGRGKVLMPGLINCHTHIPMTVLRGYADDYDLQTWLTKYIFPVEGRLDGRCVRTGALLGIAEAIASGTTSFTDMYYFCDDILAAVEESGIKANISRGTSLFTEDFSFDSHEGCTEMRRIHREWDGRDCGRIRIEASIHAEYTSNPKLWSAVAEYACANGIGMHVHLSETRREHEACLSKYGATPAAILDRYGVWNTRSVAAHCVWVTEADMDLLAARDVNISHNPVSNLKLASGIAPVPALLAKGINVALGTDSVASNNSHDLFEEIKTAALIHKGASGNPEAMSALDAIRLATVNGARAQGRLDECGRIAPGMDADLILLDFDRPHLLPCHNVISNLVYSARGSDVVITMVRGRVLYRDGEFTTIDLDHVRRDLEEYTLPRLFEGWSSSFE